MLKNVSFCISILVPLTLFLEFFLMFNSSECLRFLWKMRFQNSSLQTEERLKTVELKATVSQIIFPKIRAILGPQELTLHQGHLFHSLHRFAVNPKNKSLLCIVSFRFQCHRFELISSEMRS